MPPSALRVSDPPLETRLRQRLAASLGLWERRAGDVLETAQKVIARGGLPHDGSGRLEVAAAPWYWALPTRASPSNPAKRVLLAQAALDEHMGLPPDPWASLGHASLLSGLAMVGTAPLPARDAYHIQVDAQVFATTTRSGHHDLVWRALQPRLSYLEWVSANRLVPLRTALAAVEIHERISAVFRADRDVGFSATAEPDVPGPSRGFQSVSIHAGQLLPDSLGGQPSQLASGAQSPRGTQQRSGHRPAWHVQPGPDVRLAPEVLDARQAYADEEARLWLLWAQRLVGLHAPIVAYVTLQVVRRLLQVTTALVLLDALLPITEAIKTVLFRRRYEAVPPGYAWTMAIVMALSVTALIYVFVPVIPEYKTRLHRAHHAHHAHHAGG